MGYVDDIKKLNLAEDVEAQLIAAHQKEIDPLRDSNATLKAQTRREAVDLEVTQLADMGFEEAPGLLAFTRRILLSADAEEPGAVLLSDSEMGLTGDAATGATGREEISVAGTLRKFIELMPLNQEGKITLSDIVSTDEHGRPKSGDNDDPEEKAAERKARTERLAGKPVDRAAARGKRYRTASITGGGE